MPREHSLSSANSATATCRTYITNRSYPDSIWGVAGSKAGSKAGIYLLGDCVVFLLGMVPSASYHRTFQRKARSHLTATICLRTARSLFIRTD